MVASKTDIAYAYRLILGREAEEAGLEHWFRDVQRRGYTTNDVGLLMLQSEEFRIKKPAICASRFRPGQSRLRADRLLRPQDLDRPEEPILQDLKRGRHSDHVVASISRHLRSGDVFVEVGANIGVVSLIAARCVGPAGRVIAVEPFADNLRLLFLNKLENGLSNIEIIPLAASTEIGVRWAPVIRSSNKMIQDFELTAEHVWYVHFLPTVPLDLILDDRPKVNMMRLDIEGHEHMALLGASRALRNKKPIVITEYFPDFYPSRDAAQRFLAYLPGLGYRGAILCRERGEMAFESAAEIDRYFQQHPDWNWIDIIWFPS